MKSTIRFVAVCLCGVVASGVRAGADIASDSLPPMPAEHSSEQVFSSASDLRIRALENFIEALQFPAGRERALRLLAALEADPGAEAPLHYLLDCVKNSDDASEFSSRLNALLDRSPGEVALALAAAEIGAGVEPGAQAARLRRTLDNSPSPAELPILHRTPRLRLNVLYLQALRRSGNWGEGMAWLERELAAGDAIWRARLLPEAAEFYGLAARNGSVSVPWWRVFGDSERERARERFDAALDELAGEDETLLPGEMESRIGYYLRLASPERAQKLAGHLYRRRNTIDTLVLYADAAIAAKDFRTADELGQELCRRFPEFAGVGNVIRFNAQSLAGDFGEAEKRIAECTDPAIRDDLTLKLLLQKKAYPEMLQHIAGIRKLHPQTLPESKLLLAELVAAEKLRDPGLLKRIRDDLERLKLIEMPEVSNGVGYIQTELNIDLADAERLIRNALSTDAENYAYLDSLAWVQFRQGRLDEAQETIQRAFRMAPLASDLGELWLHAGEIAAARGERDQAAACFREALGCVDDPNLNFEAVRRRLDEVTK